MADLTMCPDCGTVCGNDWHARARLVEVEAESKLKYADLGVEVEELGEQNRQLRARLAEVEAERDGWKLAADDRTELHGELVERLAAVEALCDDTDDFGQSNYDIPRAWIRAAARGEGDRPAIGSVAHYASLIRTVHKYEMGNASSWDCVCGARMGDPIHSGEGDHPRAEYVRRCDCPTPGSCDGCHCWGSGEGDR